MINTASKCKVESLQMQHDRVILDKKMPRGADGKWWSGPRGTERPDIYSTLQSSYCCTSPVSITFFWNPSELTKLVQPRLSFGCHSVYLKYILGFSLFYTHNHFFWGVSGVLLRCLWGCLWGVYGATKGHFSVSSDSRR